MRRTLSKGTNPTQRLVGLKNSGDRNPHDHYITPTKAVEDLIEKEQEYGGFEGLGWEPSCGTGAISKVFEKRAYRIQSSDIRKDDGVYGIRGLDFLKSNQEADWIVMNPPNDQVLAHIKKALESAKKVCVLGRIQLLEGQERLKLFRKEPPIRVYVFSKRISCIDPQTLLPLPQIMCFSWFIWERGFKGKTTLDWIP